MNLKPRIGHIEMFVNNVDKATRFYIEILDFELETDQGNVKWIKKDHLEILLRPGKPKINSRYEDSNIGFVLYTEDLNETRQNLLAKGLEFKGTVDSEKCLTFTDLDGHWWQLVDPHDH